VARSSGEAHLFRELLARAFRPLNERPCWSVQRGHGTFLTFEFGKPHLVVREPIQASPGVSPRVRRLLARRSVRPKGQWHLWIYCCTWEVRDGQRRIGDWSSSRSIERAARYLSGQKLISVTIPYRGVRTAFNFDLGGCLETAPYDRSSEQWMFYEPNGNVLTVRAGRRYSYEPAHTAGADTQWRRF